MQRYFIQLTYTILKIGEILGGRLSVGLYAYAMDASLT